jgi:hypothetical protein
VPVDLDVIVIADGKVDAALAHEPTDRRNSGYRYLADILGVFLQRDGVGARGGSALR